MVLHMGRSHEERGTRLSLVGAELRVCVGVKQRFWNGQLSSWGLHPSNIGVQHLLGDSSSGKASVQEVAG